MYVVYYGIGNSFTGSLAARLHLKLIPQDKLSHQHLITEVPLLMRHEKEAMGRLLSIGKDEKNNEVFLLNTGYSETIVLPALKSVFDISQVSQDRLMLIDTTEIYNYLIFIGRLLYHSRFSTLGSSIIALGMEKQITQIDSLVRNIKERINRKS